MYIRLITSFCFCFIGIFCRDSAGYAMRVNLSRLSDLSEQDFLRARAYAVSSHMLSQFRPSVRLSVTRVDQSKTAEARIMQFSPHSSPIPLVFAR